MVTSRRMKRSLLPAGKEIKSTGASRQIESVSFFNSDSGVLVVVECIKLSTIINNFNLSFIIHIKVGYVTRQCNQIFLCNGLTKLCIDFTGTSLVRNLCTEIEGYLSFFISREFNLRSTVIGKH